MPANECIPYFKPGQNPTGKVVTAAVIGKRFVKFVTGGTAVQPNITPATAGGAAAGVAAHDQAVGGYVQINSNGIVPITAGGAIVAGDLISVGANGTAVKATPDVFTVGTPDTFTPGTVVVGQAIADAANGADAPIQLNIA